jgi:hypothetical protein
MSICIVHDGASLLRSCPIGDWGSRRRRSGSGKPSLLTGELRTGVRLAAGRAGRAKPHLLDGRSRRHPCRSRRCLAPVDGASASCSGPAVRRGPGTARTAQLCGPDCDGRLRAAEPPEDARLDRHRRHERGLRAQRCQAPPMRSAARSPDRILARGARAAAGAMRPARRSAGGGSGATQRVCRLSLPGRRSGRSSRKG